MIQPSNGQQFSSVNAKKISYLFTRLFQTEFHVGQSTVLFFDVTDQFSQKHLQKAAAQNQHKAAGHVDLALLNNRRNNTSVPVFYAAQCCWIHIQTAWSQSHGRRHFLQTAVSALVYGPACGIQTASAPPGINAWQDRHMRSHGSYQSAANWCKH